jgi:hypothetical protein
MNFSFDNANVPESSLDGKAQVLKPGIYNVVTEKLETGLSDKNQSPYIDWTVKDSTGAIVTQRYFVSTKVNEGKKMSAWDVTSSAFLILIMAITKSTKEDAKAKLNSMVEGITSHDQLATKLSALVIGKQFTIKINGKEVITSAGKKFVRSEFGNFIFAEAVGTNPSKLGKPYVKQLHTTPEPGSSIVEESPLW